MVVEPARKPNFLIIVADDLGFTDLNPFGGEIHTPHLKKLAERGVRFTDFHTASACSPTRSMLFSGTDNHIAGLGQMQEFARNIPQLVGGKPGYEGYLNDRVAPLPELLKDVGDYYTFISGKWHLGLDKGYWPADRGFEKAFTLLPGALHHFKYLPKDEDGNYLNFLLPLYAADDKSVSPEEALPENFYSSNFYSNKGIEFLDEKYRKGRPFFGCLTYTAPHWPLQAPEDAIAKYKGWYDEGPEVLRKKRLAAARKLGIVSKDIEPHPLTTFNERWHELNDEERKHKARNMEIYAAMVELLDEGIGKVLDKLEKDGELSNTLILFMSDNGAEGLIMEALPLRSERFANFINNYHDNSYENLGKKDSFTYIGDQWAQALTSPWSMYKTYSYEGGIRCPLILSYPPLTDKHQKGQILDSFTTVMDIFPTVLELAGVKHPGEHYKGRKVALPKGKSWVSYLGGAESYVHSDTDVTGWELFGHQAIRKGAYKANYVPPPLGPDDWQLFNIEKDPGEIHDLAKKEPEKLAELLDHWAEYVAETGLVELGPDINDKDFEEGQEKKIKFTIVKD